jgi:ADP-ribose pyrophosphatase YjhB (NUDIX family)
MIILNDELYKFSSPRAGIIPYIKVDGQLYFLIGVDRQTGEYADMGGGLKKDENIVSCAIRELEEETKKLICFMDFKKISVGIWERSNCILFCELLNLEIFNTIVKDFAQSKLKGTEYEEMSSLVWLTTDQLKYHIYSEHSKMWSKTKYTLANSCNFDDTLLSLF